MTNTAEQKAQQDFDKTLLTLSWGGLGLSLTFIKDIFGSKPVALINILFCAWVFWVVCLTTTLFSFYSSQRALGKAVEQVDRVDIYENVPGGIYDKVTGFLNFLSGTCFVIGLILIVYFIKANIGA